MPNAHKRDFSAAKLAKAFEHLSIALSEIEAQESDEQHFAAFKSRVNDEFAYYKAIYNEKKNALKQLSIENFIVKK